MTYNVFGGTLSLTQSVSRNLVKLLVAVCLTTEIYQHRPIAVNRYLALHKLFKLGLFRATWPIKSSSETVNIKRRQTDRQT